MPEINKEDADNIARAFGPLSDRDKKPEDKNRRDELAKRIAMSERPGLVKREY